MLATLRSHARRLKGEVLTLYVAYRDPRTPRAAKLLSLAVVAYALSPLDLIPDFIPVLGVLDDLIIVPAGIALALRLIPPHVIAESRQTALTLIDRPRWNRWATALILIAWLLVAVLLVLFFVSILKRS